VARNRTISILCLSLGLLGGAGLIAIAETYSRRAQDSARRQAEARAAQLSDVLRIAAAAAETRAAALAVLPVVRSAVATDASTVQELAAHDPAFVRGQDEAIELFQLPQGGGGRVSLVRLPPDEPARGDSDRKLSIALNGRALTVVALQAVEPMYRQNELGGAIAVAKHIDLRPLEEDFRSLGMGAFLRRGSQRLALSSGGTTEGTPVTESSVHLPAGLEQEALMLAIVPASDPGGPLRVAGALLALLGVTSAGVVFATSRRSANLRSEAPTATSSLDTSPTAVTPAFNTAERPVEMGALVGDKYRILRRVGSGGLAEVYLAQAMGEASFQRRVAIKLLRPELASPLVLEHFLDEARLAAQLSHPNIAHIYDLGRMGQTYFIAMEYVDGTDLEALLSELRHAGQLIPLPIALTIGIQMCEGLQAAHTAVDSEGRALGIVHRDIKPSNVLVGSNGSVKVADFGIAKANERSHGTELGLIKGTIDYMAPEQRLGGTVDARTDVYGAGAVLYELLTAQRISLDPTRLVQLDRAGWPHLAPPSHSRPDVPRELDAIIFRALKFEPKDRFASCRQLAIELEHQLVGAGGTASTAAVAKWLAERSSRVV
jgi:serine/threonine-protein kinase